MRDRLFIFQVDLTLHSPLWAVGWLVSIYTQLPLIRSITAKTKTFPSIWLDQIRVCKRIASLFTSNCPLGRHRPVIHQLHSAQQGISSQAHVNASPCHNTTSQQGRLLYCTNIGSSVQQLQPLGWMEKKNGTHYYSCFRFGFRLPGRWWEPNRPLCISCAGAIFNQCLLQVDVNPEKKCFH